MAEPARDAVPAGVTGQIAGVNGYPLTRAVVTVTDGTGVQAARTGVDAGGVFVTGPLPEGSYTVVVMAAGHRPEARAATVAGRTAALGVIELTREERLALPEPGVWLIDPMHSSVRVSAMHLGVSRVHGRFADFVGKIVVGEPVETSTIDVSIEAASIDTGNAERDVHLRSADFLDVTTHPTITYRANGVRHRVEERWTIPGELSLRGIARPVPLDTQYLGTGPDPWGGTRVGFTATARLARDEFDITWNGSVLMAIAAVGRSLDVTLDIQAVRE